MGHKNNKVFSLLLALFFTLSFVILPSVTAYAESEKDGSGADEYTVEVLKEEFKVPDGDKTGKKASPVGEGWKLVHNDKEVKSIGGYTSKDKSGTPNYGKEKPSIGFGRDSKTNTESIESPEFNLKAESKLSFWYRGQSFDAGKESSTFKIEYRVGDKWAELEAPDITTNAEGKFEGLLPKQAVQIRLSFVKKTGNLGIDDITIMSKAAEEPSDGTVTIAKARESVGQTVTVKGVVNFNDRGQSVHFEDNTAGIDLFIKGAKFPYTVGQTIKVTGKVTVFNGLTEIIPEAESDASLVSEGKAPTPKTITVAELLKGNNDSQYVKIEKATIDLSKKTLTQGEDVLPIYFIPSGITVKTGDVVDVTGVMGRYNKTIQIYGSSCTFTKIGTEEPKPEEGTVTIAKARESVGQTVTVKGMVNFNDRGQSVHFQDETAGIDLFLKNAKFSYKLGETIKVTGKVTVFNGLTEIVPASQNNVALVSAAGTLIPKTYTIAELLKGNNDSQYVKIEKATVDTSAKTLTQGKDVLPIYFIPADITVKTGDVVDVAGVMGRYNKTIQIYGSSCTFNKADDTDSDAPVIEHEAVKSANVNEDLTISAKITDNKAVSGADLYFRTKGTKEFTKLAMTAGEGNVYSASIFKKNLSADGLEYYIEASDGTNKTRVPKENAYEVEVSDKDTQGPAVTDMVPGKGESLGKANKPEISAKLKDAAGVDKNSIKLFLDGKDITADAEITESSVRYQVKDALKDGSHKVKVYAKDTLGNESNTEWSFRIGSLNHYFGQLHAHTNISDGAGSLDEAYQHVKEAGADYYAVTDHSNWFDNDTQGNLADGSCSTKWTSAHETADKYNEPGKFTSIYGYEMTWSKSTGFWGHINTFNTPGFETRSNSKMDLPNYYNTLQTQPQSVSQLNHPGKVFGDFADFGYYSEGADQVVNLVEVGNGEGPIRGQGYFPSYEYYTRALDKGWHVAPTNNQDNHKGNWLTSNTARTVILASENNRDSIYEAIRDKSIYATEDSNMNIDFTVNDKVMGSCLPKDGSKLNFKVNISDDDPIKKVSIIANGGVEVTSKDFNSNDVNWEFTLKPDYTYYYVKVEQADQDKAVTAPVWIGETEKVGVSKVSFDKTLVTPGDEVEATAELFNNEKTDLKDAKVEFYLNDVETGEKIGTTKVDSIGTLATAEAKVNWTPKHSGEFTIWAKATVNVNGNERTYTAKGSIKVTKKELVQKIVIDAAHNNSYVSGYYADSMGSLQSYLETRSTELVFNKEKITDDTFKDAGLFILTVPQSYDYKDKDTGKITIPKTKLEQSEIEAIKRYVDKGGNLIVSSLADYRDTKGEYSKDQQLNPLLESIGTQLRINDDEVIDKTEYSNQNYRLYLDNFAKYDTYGLLNGIKEGVDKYSFYSGASVILADGAKGDGVEFLVKGHETTETLDSDNAGDNVPVEKGNVNMLGAEQLKNGGKVAVSGTIFYSDYEISEEATKQYCNRRILENILEWMAPEKKLPVTNIKDLRVDKDNDGVPDLKGEEFAIEGTVTSQSEAVQPKNSFFEVVYVQDDNGDGICVFGVSSTELKVGQRVRITGNVDDYQGEFEIETNDGSIEILNNDIKPVEPAKLSTGDSMLKENGGKLIKVQGKVVDIDNVGNSLYIDDGTGVSRVYLEGYIWDGVNQDTLGKWNPDIKKGDEVSAIGLGSYDPEGARLRVRNTSEIVLVKAEVNEKPVIKGSDDVTIKAGDAFDPMEGLEAYGIYGEDLLKHVTVEGTVDTTKAGKYKLVYTVTDTDGSKTVFERIVTVEGKSEPAKNEEQDKKTEQDKKSEANNNGSNISSDGSNVLPQTGGSYRNIILAVVAFIAIAGGAAVVLKKKKKEN